MANPPEEGTLVPPYEERKTSGEPVQTDEDLHNPSADELPNKGTAAPGQQFEKPASEVEVTGSEYEGTGPAHLRGTTQGNERALTRKEKKEMKRT